MTTTLHIEIVAASTKWQRAFPRQKQKIEQAAALAYFMAKKPTALKKQDVSIAITLTGNATLRRLNAAYRGKDKPTNVLSFPQLALPTPGRKRRGKKAPGIKTSDLRPFAQSLLPLGDVVLAFETIRRESREQKKPLEDHVLHLVIHGVLHLLGYDHKAAPEAKIMEKIECDILAVMGYPPPYDDKHDSKKAG